LSAEPVVAIRDLWFSYDGTAVLEDVNLTIEARDFVSIVGPNGGGKTTLVKLMLGLLEPGRGTIRVLGGTPAQARPRMGYLPQNVEVDPRFPVSVLDVVLMGRLGRKRQAGSRRRADRAAADRALEEVDLSGLRGRAFSALSGGQRQRTLIARALVAEPELLLMDEPASHLDIAMEEGLYALLKGLNERLTVVVVSHDLGFVSQFVKRVVCVKRRVVVHPTSEITGEMIRGIYGGDVRMVRHDHRCAEAGHEGGAAHG